MNQCKQTTAKQQDLIIKPTSDDESESINS